MATANSRRKIPAQSNNWSPKAIAAMREARAEPDELTADLPPTTTIEEISTPVDELIVARLACVDNHDGIGIMFHALREATLRTPVTMKG